ncbi:OsmC family protein, partial [mine drainage metagenome]
MPESPPTVELSQVERYRFEATFPGTPYGALRVDEPSPMGGDDGPNPGRMLAVAVGHCLSSTLVNSLERAHVRAAPIRTRVEVEVGRNDRGRLRVRSLSVALATHPLDEADRPRFDHCVEIFEDFCTVSGAVRDGVPIAT